MVEGKDLRCGYLTVPEDQQHPGKQKLKLAVAIFKASTPNPAPDPYVYLSGGPGGPLLSDVGPLISRTNPQGIFPANITLGHDLILIDQRGTGYSQPLLNCPEVAAYSKLTQDKNVSAADLNTGTLQALRQCHDRLTRAGVDLNTFTTINDAADIDDLIHALGYKQVNIYGVSYGTRLALTMMRLFPGDIRSVILDSTLPTQLNLFTNLSAVTQHAFDTLFQGCAVDQPCQQSYPHLQDVFYHLVDKLNAHPVTFKDAQYGPVLLTGDDMKNFVFTALYVSRFIPFIPEIITEVSSGDFSTISAIYGTLMLNSDLSDAMYYSVECGEDMAFTSQQGLIQAASVERPEIRASDVTSLLTSFTACQSWGVKPVPAVQKQPVTSSLPTLILSSEFDPVTPTSNAKLAQQTLKNSYLFVFPGLSHGAFLSDDCPGVIMQEFMQNPHQKPDGSCIATMQEPDFQ